MIMRRKGINANLQDDDNCVQEINDLLSMYNPENSENEDNSISVSEK